MSRDPLMNRVADLERELARLRAEVARSAELDARLALPPDRWAKTAVGEGESYPEPTDEPNTYPFVFVDLGGPEAVGQQSVTTTNRQAESRDFVTNLADGRSTIGIYHYLPVGTLIPMWRHRGKWWTAWQTSNIFPVGISGTVAGGAPTSVTLPDGRTVSATNQTTATLSVRGSVYQAQHNKQWYLTGAAPGEEGGGGGESTDIKVVTVYGPPPTPPLVYARAMAGIGCMWAGRVATIGPSSGFCSDQFPDGTACLLVVLNADIGSAGIIKAKLQVGDHYIGRRIGTMIGSEDEETPVYAIRVGDEGKPAETLEGYVTFPFTKDDPEFEIEIEKAYRGWWPNVANVPEVDATWMRVINPDNRYLGDEEEPEHPYIFEGEHLAFCRANLDWEESLRESVLAGGPVLIYRAAVVQCPENPVEKGEAARNLIASPMQSLYDSGGPSEQSVANHFY